MRINDFKLERYFAKHEFNVRYLLSSSDCDGYAMSDVLKHATSEELSLWKNLELGYTESEGSAKLREAILQFYKLKSIENVVVATPGELNFISMNVLLTASDHVITIAPCYQSLSEIAKTIQCELSYWKPASKDWTYDVADLKKLIKKNTKLIVINFPHNPTGSYLNSNQLNEIVNLARYYGIYIFSDEMYHKLICQDVEELLPISDIYEKGISLWGTSKTFGLAGLRTGWLVSQDADFIKKVIAFKDYLSICNSAPSEMLSIIALNNSDKFRLPNIEKIKKNIAIFEDFVKTHSIITSFVPPQAGSTSFVELNIKSSTLNFSNQLVKNTGIMTLPSEMYDYPGKYIRIGFGRQNFSEALGVLDSYLKTIS